MSRLIINAAMVPNPGTFRYRQITRLEARDWLANWGTDATSYVGYPQTAQYLESLCPGLHVALNRAKCTMVAGDEALVCKLAYRVENPATKGQPQPEDWEYAVLECLA